MLDGGDEKADRLIDPRNDGDIPHRLLPDAQSPLLPRDDAPAAAQIDDEVVVVIAQQRPPLQDLPDAHGAAQGLLILQI